MGRVFPATLLCFSQPWRKFLLATCLAEAEEQSQTVKNNRFMCTLIQIGAAPLLPSGTSRLNSRHAWRKKMSVVNTHAELEASNGRENTNKLITHTSSKRQNVLQNLANTLGVLVFFFFKMHFRFLKEQDKRKSE